MGRAAHALRGRLERLLKLKFEYFADSRKLLAALAAHTDPEQPLSPFSEATKSIRDRDVAVFARAIENSSVTVKKDLAEKLPVILWMYQMGMILFWIEDRAAGAGVQPSSDDTDAARCARTGGNCGGVSSRAVRIKASRKGGFSWHN